MKNVCCQDESFLELCCLPMFRKMNNGSSSGVDPRVHSHCIYMLAYYYLPVSASKSIQA